LGLQPLTQEERRSLALVAFAYLQQREPATETIYLLEEQRLPGDARPLYNEAEISHMIDVKNGTDTVGRLNWLFMAFVVLGLILLFLGPETRLDGFEAIMYGGVVTTALLLLIALFILLGWNIFFVQFHELLFPPGTWTFAYTDSLIRLFPEKFFFDLGVLLSLSVLSAGILTTLIGYLLRRSLTMTREV
jgi:integral membrane protein (TIGR01906 family)